MTDEIDGTVYLMFLKGQRNQPDNKYVGVTTLSLDERLKKHKQAQNTKSRGECDRKLYKVMRKKGLENWEMIPLAELWLSTWQELFKLEKYYIRLLKPDLNTLNGSLSDEECETRRERSAQPWTCPTCLTVSRAGEKSNHRQTRYHEAIDRLLFELD